MLAPQRRLDWFLVHGGVDQVSTASAIHSGVPLTAARPVCGQQVMEASSPASPTP